MLEILNFFFIVFTGLGFSLIAVIHILYLPLKHKEIVIDDPNILYLTEYVDKFETLDENNSTDISKSKHNILFERTPIGNIIMYYENDEFKYYCDRTPSFGFLETVARKYVIVFNCKRLYKIYSEQEIEIEIEKEKKKEEDIKPKKKSVYANFKRYNNNKKTKINDDEPILQNKYKFIGKIRDFSFLQIEKKSEQKMSIQDFLKQIKNKS